MQVETFEVLGLNVDASGNVYDEAASQEAFLISEKLGLTGQQKFTQSNVENDSVAVRQLPYRKIEASEVVVYRTLFPTATKLSDYSSGPIPLEVLKIAESALEFDPTYVLYVWHPTDAMTDDPVLVLKRPDAARTWAKEYLILARWGSSLEPFEKLQAKARKILYLRARSALIKARAEIDMLENTLRETSKLWVQGESGDISDALTNKFALPTLNNF